VAALPSRGAWRRAGIWQQSSTRFPRPRALWTPPPARPYWPAMPSRPHRPERSRRYPKPDRRRALELLASAGAEGCSEQVLRAHGFAIEQIVGLVRAGLATATPQRTRAGPEILEVAVLRITREGRKALGVK
jgi:hypothetical protein